MRLEDIVKILTGKVLTGQNGLSREVEYAFASDLMGDVQTIDHQRTC